MRWHTILAVFAMLMLCPLSVGKTHWAAVDEGRLEIRNADLQSPEADVPSVAPLRHTDVVIQVRGFASEVTVTQQFENVLDRTIEERPATGPLYQKRCRRSMEDVRTRRLIRVPWSSSTLDQRGSHVRSQTGRSSGHATAAT